MNNYTPGPWLYDYRDNQALIVDSQGFTVVELSTLENSTAHSVLADNARLIAAAPDLLEALCKLADLYDAMGAPRGPCRIIADAAIAKAVGGEA